MELRRREFTALLLGGAAALGLAGRADAESDPLPSWNAGPAKDAIVKFVHATTDAASPKFVPVAERIATFDQDGTLWVEHPIYTQLVYCFDRVPAVVKAKPELAKVEPFRTVLSGDREAIAKLGLEALHQIVAATLTGMDVETFRDEVANGSPRRAIRAGSGLTPNSSMQPQIELLKYLRASATAPTSSPAAARISCASIPSGSTAFRPSRWSAPCGAQLQTGRERRPSSSRKPKLLLNDDNAGKPEGIHLVIGRRPYFAFGNSTGDRQMLEYTKAGGGARLAMLVLHDDGAREYAYGPAQGLPDTKVGRRSRSSSTIEATKDGWIVVSMKNDWKRIFAFE